MADNKKNNVIALVEFRLKGKVIQKGEVIPKSAFANKGDWQNLVHMKPARCEETDGSVGKPKAKSDKAKSDKAKSEMPGA